MRTLCFTQITDERFDTDIYELLKGRVQKIKELLTMDGVEVKIGDIYTIDFDGEKQCRCDFYIRKNTKAITWNGIYHLVNSVKAVPYRFTNS